LAVANAKKESIFDIPQILGRYLNPPKAPLTFSWDSCGSSSDPVQLKSLTLAPDPLVLGQNITVSFAADFAEQINAGQALITLEKKIFGIWTEIPCVDNVGSCTYDNFCTLFNPNKPCPVLEKYGIPCHCPFGPGDYALPAVSIATKDPNISWLTDGDFYAKAQMLDANQQQQQLTTHNFLSLSLNAIVFSTNELFFDTYFSNTLITPL
jgi:ganglioside GM2 activator